MQVKSKDFFTTEELNSIQDAVKRAESKTSGEIVPVLASSSDVYDRARFLSAILFSIIFTVFHSCLWFLVPWYGQFTVFVAINFLLFQIVGLVFGFQLATLKDGVRRAFIPHQSLTRQVSRAAHQAFLRFQISHTEHATGILIYVSLFERTVVVLADRSINQKHDQETWNEIRDLLINGLKDGNGVKGFIDAIDRCGEILAEDFPIAADDKNELSNELRLV